jgi:hypothetical protein
MKKIVNINENDLKRIVKRVLNERKQLNERKILNEGAYDDVEKLFNKCKVEDHGKPKQTSGEHKRIALEIRQAVTHKTWIGTPATDEDKLVSALKSIKSIGDLCAVNKSYDDQGYGDMLEEIDGDISGEEAWRVYVRLPLQGAIDGEEKEEKSGEEKTTDGKTTDGKTTDGTKSGTGGAKDYTAVSGEGSVSELQQTLKDKGLDIGSRGVDGKFGPDTLKATLKAVRAS